MGKDCVAIASDLRVGNGYQTMMTNHKKYSQISKNSIIGFTAFAPDCDQLTKLVQYEANIYKLEEQREIYAPQLMRLISSMLYEKRFTGGYFVESVVAGRDQNNQPYVTSCDGLGAISEVSGFTCSGTASEYLTGPAEYYWKENMNKQELEKYVVDVFRAGTNRDAYSGWGIKILIMDCQNGDVVEKQVDCRQD